MASEANEWKKKRLIAGALVILFVLFINFAPKLIYVNTTRSLPLGLYLAIPGKNLRYGDIVVYDPPQKVRELIRERKYGSEDAHFLKHIGGMPGDIYGVAEDKFIAHGELKGTVQRQDNAGNPMPVMDGLHIVPEGEFLPIGEKTNSLDGRYMGTVPIDSIITRVVPIATEW